MEQEQNNQKQNNYVSREENNFPEIVPPAPVEKAKPLKFLFVSLESLSGDLAWQLTREGHQVKAYIKEKGDVDVYSGFMEKVEDWQPYVDESDIIIFDDVEFGEIAENLRKKGKLVIGGSVYTDELEMNRGFGQTEMKKYGINILPQCHFSNYDEAIEFIKNNPARYVYKPSGNIPSSGKSLLFLGQEEDGNDLLELLNQNKDVWQKKAQAFQLQKYVSGVEVGIGAFFNGKDFIYPINVNFEHKRLFPGDLGPFVGEMGTLLFWSKPNTLFKSTLEKMRPALVQSGYIGYIDINCIVNGRGIYPLEFTSRFGYPLLQIQLEGITVPAGEWLSKLARGEDFELKTKRGFQMGVRILVPSYFASSKESPKTMEFYRDLPILFKKSNSNWDGIHIEDVKLEKGVCRIAGTSGCLLVVTGSGFTLSEVRKQVYTRIKNIMVQDMFYRTDIGLRWLEDSDKLQAWGYLQ
ncbi:MAG: phosphoribosylamine--glycine ligase [Parcubacteria group bacterium CG11_big_fil_rev_8_21_14_0_20_39_14]|nr:MAG: phosphoribosylamine--glycine ligase [Parcubacteria group bacterium CG11_big_fil_rev_8_21_14_0_20_39_14]PIS35554.1 MAG: phosphoribosylamine--glycine ligase [Parcubacteria group bacterium CG08_land_8_20_14_0_20_38_56]